MCRDIPAFVVTAQQSARKITKAPNCSPVDSDVEAEELNKGMIITETKESREIVRVILGGVDGRELALTEDVTIDTASDVGKLGNASITVWLASAMNEEP